MQDEAAIGRKNIGLTKKGTTSRCTGGERTL